MILHYNITVRGKVQGVFYRESTKQKAFEWEISGYVCNQTDGSVYIEAEGDELQLTNFLAWCQRGPERAEVTSVKVDTGVLINFDYFEVRR